MAAFVAKQMLGSKMNAVKGILKHLIKHIRLYTTSLFGYVAKLKII